MLAVNMFNLFFRFLFVGCSGLSLSFVFSVRMFFQKDWQLALIITGYRSCAHILPNNSHARMQLDMTLTVSNVNGIDRAAIGMAARRNGNVGKVCLAISGSFKTPIA